MPRHLLSGRPPRPALRPKYLALTSLVAASALGAVHLLSPPGNPNRPAGGPDPIALWLDTGPRVSAPAPLVAAADPAPVTERDATPAATETVASAPAAEGAAIEDTPRLAASAPKPEQAGSAEPAATAGIDAEGGATAPAAAPTVVAAPAAPDTPPAEPARAKAEGPHAVPSRWHEHTVRKGETLAQILKAAGVAKDDRTKVATAAKDTPALTKLKIGQKIRAKVDADSGLLELHLRLDAKSSLHVELAADGYEVHRIDRPVEKRVAQTAAVIQSSLFADGQDAGLSDAQLMELAAIFGWDVDFALGLRPGDRFSLVYEAEYLDGEKVDNGAILAAEFVNQGRTYRAVRFEDDDGTLGYYAPDGTSKKQAFLRSPLKLARVSSGFSLSRQHPILNTRRAHKGVDYSAPIGTPVKATGAGLVTFSGQKNGYGNVVELKHGDKYTTLYGHLSRFAEGLRVGEPVKQGEVIGYVGQTGLATGPHLHYEFRVAGEHRDPLSVKLPPAHPLDGEDLSDFRRQAAPLLAKLDRMERTMLARSE
jgi:murein DD-endopeptidase MepM/ murein hydrolase activator NlpD